MLDAFLDNDRGFVKARKEGIEQPLPAAFAVARSRRRAGETATPPIANTEE